MSISSRYKKDRLFQHINKYDAIVDNRYFESYYYLINSVQYDDKDKPVKVSITVLLNVEEWLKTGKCFNVKREDIENISNELKDHIRIYKKLL